MARDLFALKPVDTRYQFGAAVGGPLLENRLFFFASYDQQRRNQLFRRRAIPRSSTPSIAERPVLVSRLPAARCRMRKSIHAGVSHQPDG